VCYDEKFGLDLSGIATKNKLGIPKIKSLHSTPVYTIFFIGFLPGFLYLGGLDKKLFFPRKKSPRKEVEKGAVGIAGKQTGIYPQKSPGGWQIIGNCPLDLFDVHENPPSIFKAGDKIKFYPISLEEHQDISEQVETGKFKIKTEDYEG
jgi:inhibitor of KinA